MNGRLQPDPVNFKAGRNLLVIGTALNPLFQREICTLRVK
jgi:hypothetical protein